MIEWVKANLEAIVAAGVLGVPTLIQISPIKWNPWTSLARKIGQAVNGDLIKEIGELKKQLQCHIEADEQGRADSKRTRILRFNDELLQGDRHTKEHFDQMLDDITKYKRYCDTHEQYENDKAVLAIENIEKTYTKCCEERNFL